MRRWIVAAAVVGIVVFLIVWTRGAKDQKAPVGADAAVVGREAPIESNTRSGTGSGTGTGTVAETATETATATGSGTGSFGPSVEAPRGSVDSGKPWSTLPASYATEITTTSMLVNLAGEPVKLRSTQTIGAPPHPRELRVIVTERGAAAPGVPVVLGAHLMAMWSHLSAEAGGVTDARGELVVRVPDNASWALALGPRGWSRVTPIEGDTVTVVLEPAAGLEVIATEDGAAFPADIQISSGGLGASASSPDGRFAFAALPPGPAEVKVTAQRQFASGSDHAPAQAVELVPGRVTKLEIRLSGAGALIAVIPSVPAGEEASTVTHYLLAPPAPASIDAVRAAATDFRLLGGRDAMNTYEHERVPPGTHVVCAIANLRDRDAARFACATVEVQPNGIAEVPLELR